MNAFSRVAIATAILSSAWAGCDDSKVDLGSGESQIVARIIPQSVDKVDLLFVIDDSGSMLDEQEALAQWAPELFNAIDVDAAMPSLHIGVTSTDIGGTFDANCNGDGDDGTLLGGSGADCTLPAEGFLIDESDADGNVHTNYKGTLTEAFACMAQLGIDGCGFEAPLEAMKRALDGRNPGFLRDDAMLVVVFVSDEDDCSFRAEAAMELASMAECSDYTDSSTCPLGLLSSFRCFELGVTCDEAELRAAGDKHGCVAREDSPYLYGIQPYVSFLNGLKADPGMILVGGIVGPRGPVHVSHENLPREAGTVLAANLDPACDAATGGATPSVRYSSFFDSFPLRAQMASICENDFEEPLISLGKMTSAAATRSPCLHGRIADLHPDRDGLQPRCQVREVLQGSAGGDVPPQIPSCDDDPDHGPCYRISEDQDQCADTETHLAVTFDGVVDGGISVECMIAHDPE